MGWKKKRKVAASRSAHPSLRLASPLSFVVNFPYKQKGVALWMTDLRNAADDAKCNKPQPDVDAMMPNS